MSIAKHFLFRCCLLAVTAAAVPVLCGGIMSHKETIRRNIPDWVHLQEEQERISIGTENISYCLKDGTFCIFAEQQLYQSDADWLVADCFFCDADRDGDTEVILHVWKAGSFGKYQPFWRKKDDKSRYSEHLFIYDWDSGKETRLVPKWMSSEMPVSGKTVSVDGDGVICITAPDESRTFWKWEGWGLVLIESE